jgi:5-methylcytosine-specific restriction protein A
MQYTRGNLALLDHLKNGRRVFLFEQTRKAYVRFVSEVILLDSDTFLTVDTEGKERVGIKFFFRPINVVVPYDLRHTPMVAEPGPGHIKPNITERAGLVLSRVGQGAYRKSIINRWENRCAVTSHSDSRILIASHIHPWRDANADERLDVDNGILLSPTYDALFDRHLITFENSGKIVLSDTVNDDDYRKVGVTGHEKIDGFRTENRRYLERHQEVFNSLLMRGSL